MSGPAAASAPDAALLFFRWRSSGMMALALGVVAVVIVVVVEQLTELVVVGA